MVKTFQLIAEPDFFRRDVTQARKLKLQITAAPAAR